MDGSSVEELADRVQVSSAAAVPPSRDIQPDTGDEYESAGSTEHGAPPYSEADDPDRGLHCYVRPCLKVLYSWKNIIKHLLNCHDVQQAQVKGTFLNKKRIEERRKDDRKRDLKKKRPSPCKA